MQQRIFSTDLHGNFYQPLVWYNYKYELYLYFNKIKIYISYINYNLVPLSIILLIFIYLFT